LSFSYNRIWTIAMEHDQLPSELKSLAENLAALVPADGNLQRDVLMYRAGWEACVASAADDPAFTAAKVQAKSVHSLRSSWLWPLSTAGLLLVSATLGIALATRAPELRVVYVEQPLPSSAALHDAKQAADVPPIGPHDEVVAATDRQSASAEIVRRLQVGAGNEYFALRQQVLAFGVDVLRSRGDGPLSSDEPTTSDSRYGALLSELRGG
jgi:hypothetical protein